MFNDQFFNDPLFNDPFFQMGQDPFFQMGQTPFFGMNRPGFGGFPTNVPMITGPGMAGMGGRRRERPFTGGVRGAFEGTLDVPKRGTELATDLWWRPRSDLLLLEDQDLLRVEVELPGIAFDDINVECDGNSLTISSFKSHTRKEDRGLYYASERHFGNFHRRLDLPYQVDPNRVDAHMKDGVLKINLPIIRGERGRRSRIPISTGSETQNIAPPSAGGESGTTGTTTTGGVSSTTGLGASTGTTGGTDINRP
jgi:HSP20 family protein